MSTLDEQRRQEGRRVLNLSHTLRWLSTAALVAVALFLWYVWNIS